MQWYPLKFHPIYKERLWGGNKLRTVLGKPVQGDGIGESWELSGVPGDVSIVANGELAGRSLEELIGMDPEAFLGTDVVSRFGLEFPILIKFIDARLDLSIQLHPGDELARKRHNSFGKTEMWYIMDAEPGAELIIGFESDVSRETYQQALDAGTLTDLLHYEQVSGGDSFFINSGKIHAIGAGVLLAEIQQSSDVTYRVYDFDRRDTNGNLRELHTELALDAMDFKRRDDFVLDCERTPGKAGLLADSPYFTTHYLNIDGAIDRKLTGRSSFTVYLCVSGSATCKAGGGAAGLKAGECLMLPAVIDSVNFESAGCELLEVTL